jgi:drug/metabolite transporter (DMT)-like permease
MNNLKGFLYGIATSVTFGLIPLFTLPLMAKGLIFDSILFYRFLLATAALGVMMLLKKETFRIQMRDVPVLILLGLLYTGSAMFLFWGYNFMGAGVATTIHFTYPIFVTLLMFVFFREKASWITWLAILLAIAGVAKLSIKGSELTLDPLGMLIVILSAMAYASYIIVVNKSRVRSMNGRKLAFYVFIVSTLLFAVKAMSNAGIQPVPDALSWINLFLLAVVPTVISNITLVLAVHHIGGTLTSVLGAMEPVTAVCIGAFVFQEEFTWQSGFGILLIITAVTLIILSKTIQKTLSTVVRKIRPRHA